MHARSPEPSKGGGVTAEPGIDRTEEWKECRNTIGRMDTILEALRKFGFSLITALLTASALFGAANSHKTALALAAIVIMVLVVALYAADTYYNVLLNAAAERGLTIELASANPQLRLTRIGSEYVTRTHAFLAIFLLYLLFLVATIGMGYFGSTDRMSHRAVVGFGLFFGVVMIASWVWVNSKTKLQKMKHRDWPPDDI